MRFLVLVFFFLHPLHFIFCSDFPPKKEGIQWKQHGQNHFFSVCSVFNNEEKFLKEWIEYHRLIGVDHFYLYNNKSSDSFIKILKPYIRERIVTLIEWPDYFSPSEENESHWALGTKFFAYEHAIKTVNTKWLAFLDVDEFLVPVQDILRIFKKYEKEPGLILSCDWFDASQQFRAPPRRLLIETIELTAASKTSVYSKKEKMIVQPQFCKGFVWPPYQCVFEENKEAVSIPRSELRINQYVDRKLNLWQTKKIKKRAYFNYSLMDRTEVTRWLEDGFEFEDQEQTIQIYVPELLKKLGIP